MHEMAHLPVSNLAAAAAPAVPENPEDIELAEVDDDDDDMPAAEDEIGLQQKAVPVCVPLALVFVSR